MKFKNKEDIKTILEMDIADVEKKNLLANLKNHKADLIRTIKVNKELDLELGNLWDNMDKATSWTDRDAGANGQDFIVENDADIEYVLYIEGVEGFQVQYFDYDDIFTKLYIDNDMNESEAEEIANLLANDEVYIKMMELLGADGSMQSEAEVLIAKETKMEIVEISDAREDLGYIIVNLKEV